MVSSMSSSTANKANYFANRCNFLNNSTFLIIIVFLTIIVSVKCEKIALHHVMDEHELRYYFSIDKATPATIPDYEIIDLKVRNKRSADTRQHGDDFNNNNNYNNNSNTKPIELTEPTHSFQFNAFNRSFSLKLRPNPNLISPNMRVWTRTDHNSDYVTDSFGSDNIDNCFYLHNDAEHVAALSNCHDDQFTGIILTPKETLEIQPLSDRLYGFLNTTCTSNWAHLIKRVKGPPKITDDVINLRKNRIGKSSPKAMEMETESIFGAMNFTDSDIEKFNSTEDTRQLAENTNPVVEVGIFFDEAAYKIFGPYFDNDARKVVEMLLAYMNGVQALYHHQSLGTQIDITIVHLEIMRKQPASLPTYNGERDQLLDSFCAYQKRLNPPDDKDPNHWDMAVYISGLDFYSYDGGYNSGTTMGLATVRGVCTPPYDCVMVEFGTKNAFGKPYPSAGFTSIYIAVHEMGHNLGMSHDSNGNYCSKEGYIMSPSRGVQGETTWSSCSAEVARSLLGWAKCLQDRPAATRPEYNSWKYRGIPGQVWSSKRQCELLLNDKDAMEMISTGLEGICQSLQCRSPHRVGYYFSGPALEGTVCGPNMWCRGGSCVEKRDLPLQIQVVKGGWGQWKSDKCTSGCMANSKGFQSRRRVCDSPKPINTDEGCDGSPYDVILCNDSKVCYNRKRKSSNVYATEKCKAFSRKIALIDPKGVGLQGSHEPLRLWMGCAIFCKRKGSNSFYTPRLELNDLGIDPYFPDGTLCHMVKNEKYYCLQHHCLPEGFQFTKNTLWLLSGDVPMAANANPYPNKAHNKKLLDYLSLDAKGRPLLTEIGEDDLIAERNNEQWTDDKDYRELPRSLLQNLD